jgi:hypothetical protein
VTIAKDTTRTRRLAVVAPVFAAHVVVTLVLYRGRVVNHWRISDSDIVVFYIPALVATAAYYSTLARLSPVDRMLSSFGLAALSWGCFALFAFNAYGT